MNCIVFRCSGRSGTYLYLREGLSEADLPDGLRQRLGLLTEVLRLDLQPGRRLAQADAATVLAQLGAAGWYLQLPPDSKLTG